MHVSRFFHENFDYVKKFGRTNVRNTRHEILLLVFEDFNKNPLSKPRVPQLMCFTVFVAIVMGIYL